MRKITLYFLILFLIVRTSPPDYLKASENDNWDNDRMNA